VKTVWVEPRTARTKPQIFVRSGLVQPGIQGVATWFDLFDPRVESTRLRARTTTSSPPSTHPCSPPANRVRCFPKPHPPRPSPFRSRTKLTGRRIAGEVPGLQHQGSLGGEVPNRQHIHDSWILNTFDNNRPRLSR
jgi:hypothetical protein